jgi:hypothetical protein
VITHELLVEVLDVEVGIPLAVEPHDLFDQLRRHPAWTRVLASSVDEGVIPVGLEVALPAPDGPAGDP